MGLPPVVERIRPGSDEDWLIVAGDVGEIFDDIAWALDALRGRFAKVIWAPGNHELWSHPSDPVKLRGVERYMALVALCRRLDVITPEDDYPVWPGAESRVVVAPLFVLYDYSWTVPGTTTKEDSLQRAYDAGVVCTDEILLFPDPYPDRESWCSARLIETEKRLTTIDAALPTVLVSHWPLRREPTEVMWHPEFAQWCGTYRTADWHLRFRATATVYGHLHIPRTTWHDGVPFEEVSLGYPREWTRRGDAPQPVRRILSGRS
ncbi:metallophosphoesterase [Nocardioides sp. InS609-2]|uniref:metallophosphoesterase family protein n=1 Tax=Nocardioides sp. InS609-2 TaxID=2760705 RepID=UPI0020BFC0A2|nr:metallophosphoesterase [Nocardioides sp. InS609-2]